jgi:hypothetical protein
MEIKYTVVDNNNLEETKYSAQDVKIAGDYTVYSFFNPKTDFIQAEYLVENSVIAVDTDYKKYTILFDSEFKSNTGASRIRINPEKDVISLEYTVPQVDIDYGFYRNLFNVNDKFQKLFIDSISEDRTEIRLLTFDLTTDELVASVESIKSRLSSESTFSDFLILVDGYQEDLLSVNISTQQLGDGVGVVVKLYQPLPSQITLKAELQIVEEVSDRQKFSVLSETIIPAPVYKKIAGPNFRSINSLDVDTGTDYLSSVELLDVNTYTTDVLEVISRTSDKSATLGIDYGDYSKFIYFSSAVERLKNFVYKVQLIESYKDSLGVIPIGGSITDSKIFFETSIQNTVKNFDHYERSLYFESRSYSWPKQNQQKPYELYSSTSSQAVTWYSNQLEHAEQYDNVNYNRLINTLPQYLKDDSDNEGLITFVDMLGQHFDNIKIYSDAISKKYDTDNRIDRGISKNLLEPILENFGVKLYTNSNKSSENLFKYFITTDSEVSSEVINEVYSIGDDDYSEEYYRQDIYKRLYHNLPLLLKTKGTERGIKVLMSTFGIPSNMFQVKTYGGTSYKNTPYFALEKPNVSGSLGKIRLDTTGSVEGTVLVSNTSIQKRQPDYQTDLHVVEVGPSPADNINRYILENISQDFNIDQYIGDPRGYRKNQLDSIKIDILGELDRYDLKDFIRLIRFYDNTFFRMVRDFLPGRDIVDSGIIIKSHILEHNLGEYFSKEATNETLEGEITTAFLDGSDAGSFGAKSDYVTSYTETIQAPNGLTIKPITQNGYTLVGRHDGETPRYTGEFSGSVARATDRELNDENEYKKPRFFNSFYNITPITRLSRIPATIDWELIEGTGAGEYVDANIRIFSNSIQIEQSFITSTGTLSVFKGDSITVQYFYDSSSGVDIGIVNPRIQLIIDGVLIASQNINPSVSATYTHTFQINDNTSILVQSIGDIAPDPVCTPFTVTAS